MTVEKRVVRVTRSPMNARRWVMDLECGHEEWVTCDRKPKRKTAPCCACSRAAGGKQSTEGGNNVS